MHSAPQSGHLVTPPLPRLAPEGVFDAFAWCKSDRLAWRSAAPHHEVDVGALDGRNPGGMVFVFHDDAPAAIAGLPRELARLHVPKLGLGDAWALAPYAIDDATDELYEARVRPRDALWLATSTIDGLVWGLHDWAHFHNHGPFERRAWTELQCDVAALAWLRINAERAAVGRGAWESIRLALADLSRRRFAEEGEPFDPSWLAASRVEALAGEAARA